MRNTSELRRRVRELRHTAGPLRHRTIDALAVGQPKRGAAGLERVLEVEHQVMRGR